MHNYFRAIKETFRHRFLICSTLYCALMIGVLWGGNIAAVVYPITEICLKNGTFTTWLDEKIDDNDKKIQSLQNKKHPAAADIYALKNYQLRAEWYRWLKPYAETYTPKRPFQTVVFLMVIVFIGTVIRLVFAVVHSYLSSMIANGAAMRIREQLYQKILLYEADYFSKNGVGNTMSRLTNDVKILASGLDAIYGKIVREPLKLIVCLVCAAYISWQLLLLSLVVIPVAAYLIRWLAVNIKRSVKKNMEETAKLFGRIEESFRAIRIVKAFVREPFERHKFHCINYSNYCRSMKTAKYGAFTNPVVELFGIVTVCLAVIVGAYLVMGERSDMWGIPLLAEPIDVGTLVLFFALLAGAADPARKLSDIFTQFQSAAAAADRVYALIDKVPAIQSPQQFSQRLVSPAPDIRFEHINFFYTPDRPVLRDVSLDIAFGECTAILGSSGCGKSTLVNLLPRFADPTSGTVYIGGQDIAQLRLQELRRQIGFVSQEPILFNDTVWNNIRYGRADATREEVIAAAKQAFAHDFIEQELQDGYDTVVGPGGGQLSGGQRQRIALARAMICRPAILLLDEATSQIDVQSERMIHQALETFKNGRTVIMVTHRLTALSLADKVVLMNDGCIVAAGQHDVLVQTSPEYAAFVR